MVLQQQTTIELHENANQHILFSASNTAFYTAEAKCNKVRVSLTEMRSQTHNKAYCNGSEQLYLLQQIQPRTSLSAANTHTLPYKELKWIRFDVSNMFYYCKCQVWVWLKRTASNYNAWTRV